MKGLKSVSIAQKLITVFVGLSLVWCLICALSIKVLMDTEQSYSGLLDRQTEVIANTKDIQFQAAMQNYVLAAYMVATGAGALGDQKSENTLKASNQSVNDLIQTIQSNLKDESAIEKLESIKKSNQKFAELANQVIELSKVNRVKAEILMQNEVNHLSKIIVSTANEIALQQQQNMSEEQQDNQQSISQATSLMLWIAGALLFLSVLASYFVSRKMSKPLVSMVEYTKQVSQGNLKNEHWVSTTRDEIGVLLEHFKTMTENLRYLIENIMKSSRTIGDSVGHWQESAEVTSQASESIAKAMQMVQATVFQQRDEMTATLESAAEVSAGVEQIHITANQSADYFNKVMDMTRTSSEELVATARQMESIREAVARVEQQFGKLETGAGHIGKIIMMISSIAKQTNMLALNASIEAARSGIHGKGFAVIANEVRKLSIQTDQSAKGIQGIVLQIQSDIDVTNETVANSVGEVEQGMLAVGRAEKTFDSIHKAIMFSAKEINDVSRAAHEIKGLTAQMVSAIGHIDEMSQSTSAKTQEVSAATEQQLATMDQFMNSTEELAGMAEQLQACVQQFKW